MVNNDESQNMGEDYLDFGRIRQENNVTENFNIKKGSDVSDDKTVKFRYSVRRNWLFWLSLNFIHLFLCIFLEEILTGHGNKFIMT